MGNFDPVETSHWNQGGCGPPRPICFRSFEIIMPVQKCFDGSGLFAAAMGVGGAAPTKLARPSLILPVVSIGLSGKSKRSLELCAGSRSWSKALQRLGWEIVAEDALDVLTSICLMGLFLRDTCVQLRWLTVMLYMLVWIAARLPGQRVALAEARQSHMTRTCSVKPFMENGVCWVTSLHIAHLQCSTNALLVRHRSLWRILAIQFSGYGQRIG